jgi:hypothetical protein
MAKDSATHTVANTAHTAVLADRSASLSLRLRMSTAEAITAEAHDRGLTQKQLVCQALAAVGVAVTASDLDDHTPRRYCPAAAITEAPPAELGQEYVAAHINFLANSKPAQRMRGALPLAAGDSLTWGLVVCQTPILGNLLWPGQ